MSSNTRCSGLSRQRGQVAGRNYPPTNKNTLIRALTEEWDKLPQQLLDNVVQSMDGALFLFTPMNKSASELKEIILDVRFPKQKNRRVIFQCGDRTRLTSEHAVLLTAILLPRLGQKLDEKVAWKMYV
ncbi:uncharacterized protein TNCV_980301 [Trichonephila clavipes]|uniref:Uncharacterized protein n=1 Tax=Trichonephila clavipes TaxID=2585209 RepID=A0A8X6S208_TRICX|nr:uncharacterized protein TNCV_980301 [Trichonephila clavipes]